MNAQTDTPTRRGAAAESVAEAYLSRHGLTPIARNVRFRGGEIDLVLRDGEEVVFVEVRYRARALFGSAAESVTTRKQQRLLRAAQLFLQRQPILATLPCRFDVVALAGASGQQIEWIRDAFRAD